VDFGALARAKGFEPALFDQCLATTASAAVQRDASLARAMAITGTPTFLFGVLEESGSLRVIRRETGAIPFEPFAKMLEEVIATVEGAK
jgi:predicted DsbA family dithiol-disulfide isomerase